MISSENRYSEFDFVASRYDAYEDLDSQYETVMIHLEKLVLQHLPEGAHLLDIGCGTGQVAKRLLQKGYKVTGIDGSEAMLQGACKNAPSAKFLQEDMRFFKFASTFHAVISTDVALNYVMSLEELKGVFQNVYTALLKNGLFGFQISLEEETESYSSVEINDRVTEDYAIIVHTIYDSENKVVRDYTTKFELNEGSWQRSDTIFLRRLYSKADVQSALENLGLTELSIYDGQRDLGIGTRTGRVCFICRKN